MSEIARIKEVGIKKGDIVKIKWKPLAEIIEFYKKEGYSPSNFLQETELDYQLSALLNDGHYLVDSVNTDKDEREIPQEKRFKRAPNDQKLEEVCISNHNNHDGGEFTFNENFVDEISIEHDAAETYFSDKFNLSIMKIDGGLFINGKMLTKKDGKLIDILENTISDLAIQKMLEDSTEKEG